MTYESYESGLARPHQQALKLLHTQDEVTKAKEKGVAAALGHTIRVCDTSSKAARALSSLGERMELDIAKTSLEKRKIYWIESNRPSNKVSERGINDLKALAKRVRETQIRVEVQSELIATLRQHMKMESKLCGETGEAQLDFENRLKDIHAKMYQDGANPSFSYYVTPGLEDDRDCFPVAFQRFRRTAHATLGAISQKIQTLNEFKEKLEAQLQNGVVNADLNKLERLMQEVPEDVQMVSGPVLKVETDPGTEARDVSKESPAAALKYGMEHLHALDRVINFTEAEYAEFNVLCDAEIDEKFPLKEHGYPSPEKEKTLTEKQFNELVDLVESSCRCIDDLRQRFNERQQGLESLANSLDKDKAMFKAVLEAEEQGSKTFRDELHSVNGDPLAETTERKTLVQMATNTINDALDSDTRSKEALVHVRQEIMDLLVRATEEAEKAAIVDDLPIEEETVDETAVEEPATEAMIETTVNASVRAMVDIEKSVETKATEVEPVDDSTETATTTAATTTETAPATRKSRVKRLRQLTERMRALIDFFNGKVDRLEQIFMQK